MIHEFVVRDEDTDELLEVFDVDVPFGEIPPKYVVGPKTGLRAYKNFCIAAINIPGHFKAGSEAAETHSTAKKAFSAHSRRNRTSLRDVAKAQLRRS